MVPRLIYPYIIDSPYIKGQIYCVFKVNNSQLLPFISLFQFLHINTFKIL